MAIWMWLAAMTWCALGSAMPDWFTQNRWSTPPESHVRDDNGFFKNHPEILRRLSDSMRELETEHGFKLHLVVEPALIGTSPTEMAGILQDLWVPDSKGFVVVFEADSRSIGFGQVVHDDQSDLDARGVIPSYALAAILNQVKRDADSSVAPESYIENLMRDLVDGFSAYFIRRAEPPPAARNLRIALLAVGSLAVVGLAAILLAPMLRHPSISSTSTFRFPAVERPERLGAPFGGGNVTTRKFGDGSKS